MTSGDARFAELYDGYYRKVLLYCRRRTRPDQVDDAVAETFLTAWRKIDDVPSGADALPWLYAVAYRAIGHQYRSLGRHRKLKEKLSSVGVAEAAHDSAELVVMDQESRQVLDALSKLRPADQELLRLVVWEELSSTEIASVLGVSEVAARKRSTRAKAALVRSYERLERTNKSPAAQRGGAL
jgi:RNA polymerase sigma-70 factor (ECF subfamily)